MSGSIQSITLIIKSDKSGLRKLYPKEAAREASQKRVLKTMTVPTRLA
jgi:hypothetical protein